MTEEYSHHLQFPLLRLLPLSPIVPFSQLELWQILVYGWQEIFKQSWVYGKRQFECADDAQKGR